MQPSREGTADLFEAIYSQRAMRYFAPDPVPDDLLWQVIEAATKAPSASNNQAWGFVIVRDAARRSAIAALLREVAPEGSPLVQRALDGSQSSDRTIRLMRSGVLDLVRDLDHAPVFIIPCVYPAPDPAARGIRAGGSIYGAIQNLQLAARGLGLGTVLTGFDGVMGPQLRTLLKLPDEAEPVAFIPLGFPGANFGPTNRKPVGAVTHWEEWGQQRAREASA